MQDGRITTTEQYTYTCTPTFKHHTEKKKLQLCKYNATKSRTCQTVYRECALKVSRTICKNLHRRLNLAKFVSLNKFENIIQLAFLLFIYMVKNFFVKVEKTALKIIWSKFSTNNCFFLVLPNVCVCRPLEFFYFDTVHLPNSL